MTPRVFGMLHLARRSSVQLYLIVPFGLWSSARPKDHCNWVRRFDTPVLGAHISGANATFHNHLVLRISNGPVWWLRFQKSAGAISLGIASQDRTVRILHMSELQTLFADPNRLENDAESRGGLVIGQGPDGEPEIMSMPSKELSRRESRQAGMN